MKIGIIITARLGSSRLARKHLMSVLGEPLLSVLIGRIRNEFALEIKKEQLTAIIATTSENENQAFEQFSNDVIKVFFGSKTNIPLRHRDCMNHHHLDACLAVDGDDILCSVAGMRLVYESLKSGSTFVATKGLPFGMNCVGYSKDFLSRSLMGHENAVLETGWGRIFTESKAQELLISGITNNDNLRFTLDYKEDYDFFASVIKYFDKRIAQITDLELVDTVIKNQMFEINRACSDQYWENFHKALEGERNDKK